MTDQPDFDRFCELPAIPACAGMTEGAGLTEEAGRGEEGERGRDVRGVGEAGCLMRL